MVRCNINAAYQNAASSADSARFSLNVSRGRHLPLKPTNKLRYRGVFYQLLRCNKHARPRSYFCKRSNDMTKRIDRELAATERRLNAVRMTTARRAQAISAMRTGFLIAEGAVWLGRALTGMRARFSARRDARLQHRLERPAHS
jgi:hypothetical protein